MRIYKRIDSFIICYLFFITIMVVMKMVGSINIMDVVYLVALLCCVLKFLMILREDRK